MSSVEDGQLDLTHILGRIAFALGFCLMAAASYLGVAIHEIAHGLAAFGLGGRFYGLDLGPFGAQAYLGGVQGISDRAAVAAAGILGQLLTGVVCLVLLSRVGEGGFTLHSFLLWMTIGNLADPSLSLLTVSRDARRFIYIIVLRTGFAEAFRLTQISGLGICLLAVYVVESKLKSFLLEWFPTVPPRRARLASFAMLSTFAAALASFRLLSTWGVPIMYPLLYDALAGANTTLLVLLLRGEADSGGHRRFAAKNLVASIAAIALPHLLLLTPDPFFVPIPIG